MIKHIFELQKILSKFFKGNKSRIICLSYAIIALFITRTVNLSELSQAFHNGKKPETNYKRLQRFFRQFRFSFVELGCFVMHLFPMPEGGYVLIMDRTEWRFGKQCINILVLSIQYQNIAVPIIWHVLDKKGSTNYQERIKIIQEFIDLFGEKSIACLLGDREFIGKEWISWLMQKKIHFTIRTKDNLRTKDRRDNSPKIKKLFNFLKRNEGHVLKQSRTLFGYQLYFAAWRNAEGELIVVITNHEPHNALALYQKRWGIETLFGFLKEKGFNFESTHITNPERISTMLSVLAIAFCWAYKVGEWCAKRNPIKVKKHGRKAKSIFRTGLDKIRHLLITSFNKIRTLLKIMQTPPIISYEAI